MLHKLQENFRDYIIKGKYTYAFAKTIKDNGISGPSRLDIYKNNVFANTTKALQTVYPKTMLWVGEEYFNHLCQNFVKKFPPSSGVFIEYGEPFASYLVRIPELKNFPFLPSLAKLEWLIHRSHHSFLENGITAQDCSKKIVVEGFALRLRSDVFLLKSKYNVINIFEESQPVLTDSYFIIYRDNFEVKYNAITKNEYVVLKNLKALNDSLETVATVAKYINLGFLHESNL